MRLGSRGCMNNADIGEKKNGNIVLDCCIYHYVFIICQKLHIYTHANLLYKIGTKHKLILIYVRCLSQWMNGWMHAWMDGYMHGWMDEWIHAWMDG